MSDEPVSPDDQSHYEISLTAAQAFMAFVLLLLSLAASFAFGLLIGRNQSDERLVVRKEPAIINEGVVPSKGKDAGGQIVELPVATGSGDFKGPRATASDTSATTPVVVEGTATATAAAPASTDTKAPAAVHPDLTKSAHDAQPAVAPAAPAPAAGPVYAQLLSTNDQKTAETLAARLIDHGFTGAYVERVVSDKGTIFRVRIRFATEGEARAAEPKLREYSKEVWITAK
ncbi:MAG TPA: SPOR domain-containing protein [Thermoanaerobaculia bacterium]|nr:SPOR domain-containing protein [Thermoanaerobaculia bacterium]